MSRWSPQLFQRQAQESGVAPLVLANALAAAKQTRAVNADLPPVFTLKHIAHLTDVDYGLLRAIVSRTAPEPYRTFRIRKRPAHNGELRFRVIAVPSPSLVKVQRWITQAILSKVQPHAASVAFSKGDTLLAATEPHCGCHWLVKLDVRNFFESINEISVYRVFHSLGYQPLISLELARLCTRLGKFSLLRARERWRSRTWQWKTISSYEVWRNDSGPRIGHLPQGAPTSPMLANLAVREFDEHVTDIAERHGLIYTRYADDLTFSTRDKTFTRSAASKIIGEVYAAMGRVGLSPNVTKTRVTPPGSRKIVLGLLVDGTSPHLPREFKLLLRQHIYYLIQLGPVAHANAKGFSSTIGLKHHLQGLVGYATQIEPDFGNKCSEALKLVKWPL